jgi:hypothetical protein
MAPPRSNSANRALIGHALRLDAGGQSQSIRYRSARSEPQSPQPYSLGPKPAEPALHSKLILHPKLPKLPTLWAQGLLSWLQGLGAVGCFKHAADAVFSVTHICDHLEHRARDCSSRTCCLKAG